MNNLPKIFLALYALTACVFLGLFLVSLDWVIAAWTVVYVLIAIAMYYLGQPPRRKS